MKKLLLAITLSLLLCPVIVYSKYEGNAPFHRWNNEMNCYDESGYPETYERSEGVNVLDLGNGCFYYYYSADGSEPGIIEPVELPKTGAK